MNDETIQQQVEHRVRRIIEQMAADCRSPAMRLYIDQLTPKMLSIYREPKMGRAQDLEHLGTGMLVQHRRKFYASTAAHVLDNAADFNLGVFRTADETRNVVLPDVRYSTPKLGGKREADRIDLGVVPLLPEHVAFFGTENFLTVADCDLDHAPTSTSLYTALGYPNRRNEPSLYRATNIKPSRLTYSNAGASPKRYREAGISARSHVAFTLDPKFAFNADGTQSTPPKRVGMSGGACIHFHNYKSSAAHLLIRRPKIVGVVIENPLVDGTTLLIATHIRSLFHLIEDFQAKYPQQ